MSEATDRPQDLTSSRAKPAPDPATSEILERYRSAMRRELAAVLNGIAAAGAELPMQRAKRWDLAIKLGRELGARDHVPAPGPSAPRASTAKPPRLTKAQRKELG